jgi:endoglucanase
MRDEFDQAAKWSKEHKRPIYLGEFGAYEKADLESRVRWTTAIVREAEKRGFSWAYWEFGASFGAYDRQQGEWREPLLKALQP